MGLKKRAGIGGEGRDYLLSKTKTPQKKKNCIDEKTLSRDRGVRAEKKRAASSMTWSRN